MKKIVYKYVLKNALKFNGSVNLKVVLGIILKEKSELKKDVPKVLKEIETQAQKVNRLSLKEIKKELQILAPELLVEKKKVVEGPLKSLQNISNKFKVRIAPSPSGPLHIGHAYGGALNFEYAQMYKGKFIVRIEDTNPGNIYSPSYQLIKEDTNWLTGNKVSEVVVQSDRLGIYYDHAEKLVSMGKAYVCDCDNDNWREMKAKGEACTCRSLEVKKQQVKYAKMFGEYAEGEVVLRLKTDIKHKNPAMRDFPIMRINEHVHPKTGKKQRVWPLMVLSVAIDDHLLGITHVLNGKDHVDNAKKETMIMNYLGWKEPVYKHWGKINFEGFKLSTSKTKLAIEQGEYTGWEDIRLATLKALRKRGYQPEALRKFAIEIGLSLNDKTVSWDEFWKMINSFNRDIIEPKANRYFFVDEPEKIKIENFEKLKKELKLNLHPDFPKRGKRIFKLNNEFLISKTDFNNLDKKKLHRLIDCLNFKFEKGKIVFDSKDYEIYQKSENKGSIIQWVPLKDDNLKVEIVLEGNKISKGIGEASMCSLKEGDIVQLQRKFFVRVDSTKKGKIKFYYLHK